MFLKLPQSRTNVCHNLKHTNCPSFCARLISIAMVLTSIRNADHIHARRVHRHVDNPAKIYFQPHEINYNFSIMKLFLKVRWAQSVAYLFLLLPRNNYNYLRTAEEESFGILVFQQIRFNTNDRKLNRK